MSSGPNMAVIHRALFVWFLVLIFSIMLVLHLDHRTEWSWFVVFVPMWIFDALALNYIGFNIVMDLKNGHNRFSMRLKVIQLSCFLLKLAFQVSSLQTYFIVPVEPV